MFKKIILVIFILTGTVFCGDWHWESDDPYYFVSPDWKIQAPDKWQHFAFNYFAVKVFDGDYGLALIMTVNIVKELNDGYYEGASLWDMVYNVGGVICAKYDIPLIMSYEADGRLLRFTYYWR